MPFLQHALVTVLSEASIHTLMTDVHHLTGANTVHGVSQPEM